MERIDLSQVPGRRAHRRWHTGWIDGPFVTVVTVGRLPDGRWYAERYGRGASRRDVREGACVYADGEHGRHLAMATARRWMRAVGGDWTPVPAGYDAQQRPIDGLPWERHGRGWVLPEGHSSTLNRRSSDSDT